ncbi:MAG: hypothetical protein JWL77_3415 [Chthonomonadaceae bacterium]|nr:hypothetical protein [Chthonomonadaceae bacterium]
MCKRIQEEYEWRNDHFLPGDPFDIVFLMPWDDLEIVEVIMECEDHLGIEIKNEDALAWSGTMLGNVVDTLLAKCKAPAI